MTGVFLQSGLIVHAGAIYARSLNIVPKMKADSGHDRDQGSFNLLITSSVYAALKA